MDGDDDVKGNARPPNLPTSSLIDGPPPVRFHWKRVHVRVPDESVARLRETKLAPSVWFPPSRECTYPPVQARSSRQLLLQDVAVGGETIGGQRASHNRCLVQGWPCSISAETSKRKRT